MMRSVANGFALALALALATPAAALACSVDASVRGSTVEERTRAADYVIVGWVERTHDDPLESGEAGFWDTLYAMGRGQVADIAVREWLKGDGPDLITVIGFARGPGECRSPVPEGTAVMFLSGDAADGELALNQISVHDAVTKNSPEVTRRVRAAVVD
jgi:hypothetical protein